MSPGAETHAWTAGTALVTGGSGFVGSHIVRALIARGVPVRCLVRESSSSLHLAGLPIERVSGDLRDASSVREAVRGCRAVFHCAADYRLYARRPADLYDTNVEGSRHVFRAALEEGVERLVHTSTVGALGLASGGVADEDTPVRESQMIGHYKRSKFQAERLAERWARRGLPVVIVNPSTPVGDGDLKPTPTGQIIVDFLRRRMPAYVDSGLNLIDVRDVALGHLLAADRGQIGRRYILGHENLSLRQIFQQLEHITSLAAPRHQVPHWLPILVAAAQTTFARLSGGEPRVALEAARMSRYRMYFDSSRAVEELGLPQTPVRQALKRAVEWFRAQGYA